MTELCLDFTHKMCKNCILLVFLLIFLPSVTLPLPLEAAFQGRCEEGNPCDQICFNLHDNMYECDCRDHFNLHPNGYNCLPSYKNETVGGAKPVVSAGGAGHHQDNINIQIEVDIEPPLDEADNLSSAELERLGLPSHHIHYRAGQVSQPEVLAPEDIKVSYTVKDEDEEKDEVWDDRGDNIIESVHTEHQPDLGLEDVELDHVDPPRALPDTLPSPYRDEWSSLEETRKSDKFGPATYTSDHQTEESDQSPLKDWIYDVPALCGLDCGLGRCHSEREGSAWLSRCLCPAGFHGRQCSLTTTLDAMVVPEFSGLSHLALPILQNAYSDLHLSLDFKPTSDTGLLLLTGETDDMTGDYLALVIIDGYIELRLDCGTGPGVVRSNSRVLINQWNQLAVNRHDWGVWIQLNQGRREEGRSQGLFSRITFNQPVYIGGQGDIKNTKSFLGVETGFQGCVRNLEINKKRYDLNPSILGGDVMSGLDIGRCSVSGCWDSQCGNGTCRQTSSLNTITCDCPLGFTGDRCQDVQHVQIPRFEGDSYLRHHGLGDSALLVLELEVVFKPDLDHGLLIFNGDTADGRGDMISLYLVDGYVEFAMNLGSGIKTARSKGKVMLDQWQRVTISRIEKSAYLYLEGEEGTSAVDDGEDTQLKLDQFLWLGGVEDLAVVPPNLPVTSHFHGCIQKIVVNGLSLDLVESAVSGMNIDQCSHPCNESPCTEMCVPVLDSYSCSCVSGQRGGCAQSSGNQDNQNPIPGFTGSSYLFFNNAELYQNLIGRTNSINLRLRLRSPHGLILWVGDEHGLPPQHFLLLGVDGGHLQLWFDMGGGETMLQYNHTTLDDGRWHRIRATRMDQYASLMVDNGPVQTTSAPGALVQLNAKPGLYLGGVSEENTWALSKYTQGMTGCVAELSVGNLVDIDLLTTAERGNNIDTCYRP